MPVEIPASKTDLLKYEYPKRPGEVRVTYKILPERVSSMG